MNKAGILAGILDVAKAAASLSPFTAATAKVGRAALDLMGEAREIIGAHPDKVAEFDQTREELERAVNAHADRTAASLD